MKPLIALLILLTCAAQASEKVWLLGTGIYHGDEVKAPPGSYWGLFPGRSGTDLRECRVRISLAHDPIVDSKPTEKTGRAIKIDREGEPLLLLRGVSLRPGPVSTTFCGELRMAPEMRLVQKLEGREYVLEARADSVKDGVCTNYRLTLTYQDKTREVLRVPRCDATDVPRILWAGDLDRDGRLDLFLDASSHYNLSRRTLFLSSKARAGRLLEKVADFENVGC
ncbi:MAG: hypothetical protein FJX76_02275 [Armatimonadetes bacterium]|nr:hypothetical protein [Armatimonadota bacterium]